MSHNIDQQMRLADILTLAVLSLLWGGSFFFVEILIRHFAPLTIVTVRVALAAMALWGIIIARGLPIPKTRQHWTALAIIGVLNSALPFSMIAWGQTQISSGLASIFNATTPFFTVLIAGLFLVDERVTKPKLLGVMIGLLGTIIIIGPDALSQGMSGGAGTVLGQLAVMGAAISYAITAVYSRRFQKWGLSPLIVAAGQVTMAALILCPFMLIIDKPWIDFTVPFEAVWAMIGLAFFSTVVAYTLYFRLIASAGATNAALVAFLVPISAIILGVVILGETFTGPQAIGIVLIGLGLLVMDGRLFQRFRAR